MTDTIRIPFRSDNGGPRDISARYCTQRWIDHGFEVVYGYGGHPTDPFNRSASINRSAVGDWDVALFADADVTLADPASATKAAKSARSTGRMTFAHTGRHGLDAAATGLVLDGLAPGDAPSDEVGVETFSGVFAVPRPLWDEVGGFDERFVGWGYEDMAFLYACETLGGSYERVPGLVVHLWHPRPHSKQEGGPTYKANEALWERYLAARYDRNYMRMVLPS